MKEQVLDNGRPEQGPDPMSLTWSGYLGGGYYKLVITNPFVFGAAPSNWQTTFRDHVKNNMVLLMDVAHQVAPVQRFLDVQTDSMTAGTAASGTFHRCEFGGTAASPTFEVGYSSGAYEMVTWSQEDSGILSLKVKVDAAGSDPTGCEAIMMPPPGFNSVGGFPACQLSHGMVSYS